MLVFVNGTLFVTNRATQAEITSRQQFIQQTVQLENLYREIEKALAELALKNGDSQIIRMLAEQGISVSSNVPATSASASGAKR